MSVRLVVVYLIVQPGIQGKVGGTRVVDRSPRSSWGRSTAATKSSDSAL